MTPIVLTLPLRIISEANDRDGWRKKAKRAREQRGVVKIAVSAHLGGYNVWTPLIWAPLVVTMTRIGPRALDSDNLQSACKASRDGVADALGIKDNDPRVRWEYGQRRPPGLDEPLRWHRLRALANGYGIEIRVESAERLEDR